MRRNQAPDATIPATLGFALAAAPLCWLFQVAAARLAMPADCAAGAAASLRGFVISTDTAALLGSLAGGLAAFASWRHLRNTQRSRGSDTADLSRKMLLAMWALMTSVWLFGAILFNALDSLPVRACAG